MKRYIVAANWKMNKSPRESYEYVRKILIKILNISRVDVILCVPFTSLFHISSLLKDSKIMMGAQNVYWKENGAYTGEISSGMVNNSGATWVIVGHSERRHLFGETDDMILKKIRSVLNEGMKPIFCVGETLEQRNQNEIEDTLKQQLTTVFDTLTSDEIENLVIAYEPVWAIGTGINAEPEHIKEAHQMIRQIVSSIQSEYGDKIQILYGGSVNSANTDSILSINEVDGFLVGGASLKVEEFFKIIDCVENFN